MIAFGSHTVNSVFDDGVLPFGNFFKDIEIRIESEPGLLAERGEVGEIVLKSRFLSSGYWRDSDRTAATFQLGPVDGVQLYRTGDIGRWRYDGQLEQLGRNAGRLKLRGFTVEMRDVEKAILDIPNVSDLALVSKDEQTDNATLAAYVVVGDTGAANVGKIRSELAERLPSYMVPSHIAILDRLPLTSRGKVDQHALPEIEHTAAQAFSRVPSTPREKAVAKIWHEVLERQNISMDDDFFDIGGTSLQALTIFGLIAAQHGHDFPPTQMIETSTIARLAALLDGVTGECATQRLVPLRRGGRGHLSL